MFTIDDFKKGVTFNKKKEIKDICRPLFVDSMITGFLNTRLYNDGTRSVIATYPDWIDHYYTNRYYNFAKCARHPSCYTFPSYVLWDKWDANCISNKIVGKDAAENFDIAHGISIIKPSSEWCDIFDFTTGLGNTDISAFYLNNIDVLEKFLLHFRKQAKDLIKQSFLKRFLVAYDPKINIYQEYEDTLPQSSLYRNRYEEHQFSCREKECIYWLYQGKTVGEIGGILGVSKRTMEKHIINLKKKFGCDTLFQLGTKYGVR